MLIPWWTQRKQNCKAELGCTPVSTVCSSAVRDLDAVCPLCAKSTVWLKMLFNDIMNLLKTSQGGIYRDKTKLYVFCFVKSAHQIIK